MEDDEYERPLGYVFAVADKPYCCWDFDHEARTLEFLDGIDPDYFGTIAAVLADRIATDVEMPASVALRTTYQQGIETLMSLLGATAQAPAGIPAWIAKCGTDDLKDVVGRLRDRRPLLTQSGRQPVSFLDLSEYVHRFAWTDEAGPNSTPALFGRFWRRLSSELLDETARAEYNAIKHGNRVSPGGFSLAVGAEEVPGVPASPEAMRSMGGSRFGSTFYRAERVGTSNRHIRTRRTSVNWSPEALAQRLVIISMSMTNVVASLRCNSGVDPRTARFVRPVPLSAFDAAWEREPAVKNIGMDSIVRADPSDDLPREDLLAILEGRGHGTTGEARDTR